MFQSEWEVQEYLKREMNWIPCKPTRRHLKFHLLIPEPDMTLEELQEYRLCEKWGIKVELNGVDHYIVPHALASILHALDINGQTLYKMSPTDLRIILNKCVNYLPKEPIYFKVNEMDEITNCKKKSKMPTKTWSELFKEVKEHAKTVPASFFCGEKKGDSLQLTYVGAGKKYIYRISDTGLTCKENK